MFPLCYLVHLSNSDKLYNIHLKLILLSHDHLENLETLQFAPTGPAEWNVLQTLFANL